MRLWIGNMAPDTTDDQLRDFVKKYAPALECTEIQRVEDSGTRPGAIVQFAGTTTAQLENLALRLHGMYWKGCSLSCHTLLSVP